MKKYTTKSQANASAPKPTPKKPGQQSPPVSPRPAGAPKKAQDTKKKPTQGTPSPILHPAGIEKTSPEGRGLLTWVALDWHKKDFQVCILYPGGEPVERVVSNTDAGLDRFMKRLKRDAPGEIRMCYEAGPGGFELQRRIEKKYGLVCEVIAPSLIPRKPGEKVKTDRRDAKKLAELYRAGLLTTIQPPSAAEEAVRELCRGRQTAKESERRARQQLEKFLLRHGRYYLEGRAWTQKHRRWLKGLKFEEAEARQAFEEYLAEVEHQEERVRRLDEAVARVAQSEAYRVQVGWLRCFKGLDTCSAMVLLSELYAFGRFRSANEFMAFLGLTPCEHSSGGKRRQGGISKTGNSRVRRILVEAAWHQVHPPRVSKALKQRREGQPAWVIAHADKALKRLHKRYHDLIAQGKSAHVAVTAVARELAGFLWALLSGVLEKPAA